MSLVSLVVLSFSWCHVAAKCSSCVEASAGHTCLGMIRCTIVTVGLTLDTTWFAQSLIGTRIGGTIIPIEDCKYQGATQLQGGSCAAHGPNNTDTNTKPKKVPASLLSFRIQATGLSLKQSRKVKSRNDKKEISEQCYILQQRSV